MNEVVFEAVKEAIARAEYFRCGYGGRNPRLAPIFVAVARELLKYVDLAVWRAHGDGASLLRRLAELEETIEPAPVSELVQYQARALRVAALSKIIDEHGKACRDVCRVSERAR